MHADEDVKPNIFQRGKKGTYTLRFWVPERFRPIEKRKELFVSLKTTDWAEAVRAAVSVQEGILADLNTRLTGQAGPTGHAHLKAVRDLALANGHVYKPASELAVGPIEDLLRRIEDLAAQDRHAANGARVSALLGGVEEQGIMLSSLFKEYEKISTDKVRGKTPDQMRTWRNARMRAVKNLLSVIGDKPIDDIGPADALAFKLYWVERIENPEQAASEASTANKDMVYLGAMLGEIFRSRGKSEVRPFRGMRLKDEGGREIAPFEKEWIIEHLLCDNPLPGLNEEARDVLLVMVNTGCRPSELTGLRPEDIRLDAPIPYIDINRRHRKLKTDASIRQMPLWGVSLEAMKRHPEGFPTYRDKSLWSNVVGKFLREAKTADGKPLLPSDRHRPYSLRHSFEDRLTDAEVPERIDADLMGHTISREKYGKGASLIRKLHTIKKIAVTPDR